MSDQRRVVLPLHLNMGHGRVYIIKVSKVNEELSSSAEWADIEEIKIRKLENDEKNRQVIINKDLPGQELKLDYNDTTISIDEGDAKRGAAVFNKQAAKKLQEDIDKLVEAQLQLETLQKFYKEELPKENLI